MSESTWCPRGIRNNNPGNIRAVDGITWRRQKGKDEDGFCIFKSSLYGLRAIAVIWQNYAYYHGFTAIYQYLHRWAPDVALEGSDYLRVLCAAAQVSATEPYNPCDRPVPVLRAIVYMENGYCPYSDGILQQAIDLAHIR